LVDLSVDWLGLPHGDSPEERLKMWSLFSRTIGKDSFAARARIGALLVGTAVLFGALGAHALADLLQAEGRVDSWNTAVLYQLVHGLAIWIAALARPEWAGRLRWPARCWAVGTLLFSGSIYGLILGGPAWLGPVTPAGGLALLAGWLWALLAVPSAIPGSAGSVE